MSPLLGLDPKNVNSNNIQHKTIASWIMKLYGTIMLAALSLNDEINAGISVLAAKFTHATNVASAEKRAFREYSVLRKMQTCILGQ